MEACRKSAADICTVKMCAWTSYVLGVWLWPTASLNYLWVTEVMLPWHVRALPWLRGCALPGCAPAGTMVVLALRVFAEAMVVPAQRAIALRYVLDVNRTRDAIAVYILCCVVQLCCPVRGPSCAVPGRAPAGTMVKLALCVSAWSACDCFRLYSRSTCAGRA